MPAVVKLLGSDSLGTSSPASNRVVFNRWTCTETGIVTTIRVYSLVSGNAKVALYSNSSNRPAVLLTSGSGFCLANQWNDIAVTHYLVGSSNIYWVAINGDTVGVRTSYTNTGGYRVYKDATYSTYTFLAVYDDTGFTVSLNVNDGVSCYGTLGVWDVITDSTTSWSPPSGPTDNWVAGVSGGTSWVLEPEVVNAVYANAGDPIGLLLVLTYPYKTVLYGGSWDIITDGNTTWIEV